MVLHPVAVRVTQLLHSLGISIFRRSRPQTLASQGLYVFLEDGWTHDKVTYDMTNTWIGCGYTHDKQWIVRLKSIPTHKVVAGSEEAGCPVGLGCIQEVVSDGHKGDFPAV